jgi:hypothetical protein
MQPLDGTIETLTRLLALSWSITSCWIHFEAQTEDRAYTRLILTLLQSQSVEARARLCRTMSSRSNLFSVEQPFSHEPSSQSAARRLPTAARLSARRRLSSTSSSARRSSSPPLLVPCPGRSSYAIQQVAQWFRAVDVDGSGAISVIASLRTASLETCPYAFAFRSCNKPS